MEIINEVGDFDKIELYHVEQKNGYSSFKDEDGNIIDVFFQKLNNEDVDFQNDKLAKPILKYNTSYNISYNFNNIQTQAIKSTIGKLMRILATITNIIKEFINKNNVDGFTLFATHRDEKIGFSLTDPKKTKLYKAVLINNINKFPGWSYIDAKLDEGFEGFILYKK
jgi:hypothetical protein